MQKIKKVVIALLFYGSCSSFVYSENQQTVRFALSNGAIPTSYEIDGESAGILPELIIALFEHIPDFGATVEPLPWKRAQATVSSGVMDAFCTYPSDSRQEYSFFADEPLFYWDYGYLIYNVNSPKADIIKNATSFEDLRGLIMMAQPGTAWEDQNIPSFIKRNYSNTSDSMIRNLLSRGVSDFLIMSAELAVHTARGFGLEKNLRMQEVDFIPDSLIPFHIGVSKLRHDASTIIESINRVQQSAEFKAEQKALLLKYQFNGTQKFVN